MSRSQQRKGADGEKELTSLLRRAGYPVSWGGNKTYGAVPDVSGLPGIHIECKRVEALNVTRAMEQAERDADRFRDGAPAVFHRRNQKPWLVTMLLEDWLRLYSSSNPTPEIPGYSDRNAHARFFTYDPTTDEKGDNMSTWKTETPVTADTGRNVLEYFKDSGQLSISKPTWTDKEGNERRGKTVFLDLNAVASTHAAVSIIKQVVKSLEK